jgi:hypothetical protein
MAKNNENNSFKTICITAPVIFYFFVNKTVFTSLYYKAIIIF